MANTYTLLQKVVVGAAGATTINFTNIPQTGYTDLKIHASIRTNYSSGSYDYLYVYVNGDSTTSRYTARDMYGLGSSSAYENYSNTPQLAFVGGSNTATSGTNGFSTTTIRIPQYTSSNQKILTATGGTEGPSVTGVITSNSSLLYTQTAPVTSLTFLGGSSQPFLPGTSFTLYGISNANAIAARAPKASGGQVITTDGTYWYHAFTNTGTQTFTPFAYGLSADILVVAGGGSGGSSGGGGGAGGVLTWLSQPLVYQTGYSAVVGSGGTASALNGAGNAGGNSQFGSLSASIGGGAGGLHDSATAGSGGSGGGAGRGYPIYGGSGTAGQGNAGGNTVGTTPYYGAAGGGGATAVGGNGTGSVGGNGGAGTNAYSSWLSATGLGVNVSGSYYIAGGGGGGIDGATTLPAGGSGGGGNGGYINGSTPTLPTAGTPNTGGGGGGSKDASTASAAGGSGLIIVRYAI